MTLIKYLTDLKSCFQFSSIDFSRPGSRFSCVSLEEMGQEVISAAKNIVIRYFYFEKPYQGYLSIFKNNFEGRYLFSGNKSLFYRIQIS